MGECPSRGAARLVLDVPVGVQNVEVQKLRAHTMPSHVILILPEFSCLGTLVIAWEPQASISGTRLGSCPSLRPLFSLTVAYRRVPPRTTAYLGYRWVPAVDFADPSLFISRVSSQNFRKLPVKREG